MKPSEKIKTLIELHHVEPGAVAQLYDVAGYDTVKQIAVMPDIHEGYFTPIGTVVLTDNTISPFIVGYDIGCGMCNVTLAIAYNDIIPMQMNKRKTVYDHIMRVIPVGFEKRSKPFKDYPEFKSATGDRKLNDIVNTNVAMQMGTLGQGNHFIELGYTTRLCQFSITIHSGSRKCGYDVADYYMNLAKREGVKFFKLDSDIGQAYLHDMNYFLDWALANRKEMIRQILTVIDGVNNSRIDYILNNCLINENHNHAVVTKDGILHRKGATPAEAGQLGIIPGNMRDGTYITRGLGNKEYLSSASHGAGRVLGRKAAKRTFSVDDFKEMMKDSNVYANICESTIDECPDAYKSLNEVIKYQDGIVIDIVDKLNPLIVIKG